MHKEVCGKKSQLEEGEEVSNLADNNQKNNQPLNLNEFEDIILDKSKLNVLRENKSIMTKLKNKKLQKIIKEIDSAKFKKKSLEKMMSDKDFKEFTDEILLSLGYLKDNLFTY